MTWGLQQREYPILTPGQMNPFNQALSSGLDTYTNMTKAAYQPEVLKSQIASKNAYADNATRQMLATVLGNPMAVAAMDKPQFQQILSQLNQGGANQKATEEPGFLKQMWNKVTGSETSENVPRRTNEGNPGTGGSGIMMPPPNSTNLSSDPYKSTGSGQAIADQVGSNHPYLKPAGGETAPASGNSWKTMQDAYIAKNFPATPQGIAAAQRISAAEAEGKKTAQVQSGGLDELQKRAAHESQNARTLVLDAEKFHKAFSKAWVKGPLTEYTPFKQIQKFDSNAVKAMNSANNMAVSLASQLFGNRQSDYREKLAQTLKLGTTMTDDAEKSVFTGIKAMGERTKQFDNFVQYAKDKGVKDYNKIENLWYNYNNDKPFYDVENEKAISQNLSDKSYKNYVNQKLGQQAAPMPENNSDFMTWNHETGRLE
jgi:hypothetical protein